MHWWLNGEPAHAVPLADRGLQYGDGVFETMRVRDGRPLQLDRHLARLHAGLQRLHIPFDGLDTLRGELTAACAGRSGAVLKAIVTRGAGGRGYQPPTTPSATRIIGLFDLPERPDTCDLRVCDVRLAAQPALAGIKHLNRLEQVLARAEWQDTARWQEGLMLDAHDRVIAATQANLFAIETGTLLTPALTQCGIAGIIRSVILDDAAPALGVATRVEPVPMERLLQCEEIFLTNSVVGVWPVRRIETREFVAPGPLTRALREWVEQDDR